MPQTPVIAVFGTCVLERRRYARGLAETTGSHLTPGDVVSLDNLDESLRRAFSAAPHRARVVEFPTACVIPEAMSALRHATDAVGDSADSPGDSIDAWDDTARDDDADVPIAAICVVDARHLLDDIQREDYFTLPRAEHSAQFTSCALVAVSHIEFASTIVVAGWEQLPTPDLSVALAIVSALSPHARLRLLGGGAPSVAITSAARDLSLRPGWLGVLNDEWDPHMTDVRVSAHRYERLRPFHPQRLADVLDTRVERGEFGTVLRSSGFCRLATRHGVTAHWEHVGCMLSLHPIATDDNPPEHEDVLSVGNDIAVIGLDLDITSFDRALDSALLTDVEFASKPSAWTAYPDPFPAWRAAPTG